MTRTRLTLATLGFLIAVAGGTSIAAAQAGPEHARLAAMTGTWDVEMTFQFQPDGQGLTTKATSTIRPLLGGLFVEETLEGSLNGTPFTTMAWTGYNVTTRLYEATRIASTSPGRINETGSFDDKAKRLDLKAEYRLGADTWHQRTVIQQTSADAMVATSYLSFGGVPEWKAVEIKYTRRTK